MHTLERNLMTFKPEDQKLKLLWPQCSKLHKKINSCQAHHVKQSHAKVDGYSCESEKVPHTVVFMDPAAELLKDTGRMSELFSQDHHKQ